MLSSVIVTSPLLNFKTGLSVSWSTVTVFVSELRFPARSVDSIIISSKASESFVVSILYSYLSPVLLTEVKAPSMDVTSVSFCFKITFVEETLSLSETVPLSSIIPFTYSLASFSFDAIGLTEGSSITGFSLS